MSETMHEITLRMDKAIETKDTATIIYCFHEDCEIILPGLKLNGIKEIKKWTEQIYVHFAEFLIIPEDGFIRGSLFFRKYTIKATLHDGSEILSKQTGVLEFEDRKIKSLRLDFDRTDFDKLDVADALAKDWGSSKVANRAIEE